jgi:hypothetical protein
MVKLFSRKRNTNRGLERIKPRDIPFEDPSSFSGATIIDDPRQIKTGEKVLVHGRFPAQVIGFRFDVAGRKIKSPKDTIIVKDEKGKEIQVPLSEVERLE